MESIPAELFDNGKLCDECKSRPAHWVENEDQAFEDRVYLCGKCAREYHLSILH